MLAHLIESLIGDFQERPVAPATRRDARLAALPGKVDVLIGMRRSGKSWRMAQAMADLVAAGTPKARLLHINLGDERLLPLATSDLQTLSDTFFRLFPDNKRQRCHFFFDEIQNVPGWEAFVRRLLDTENVQITLTGSSAKLLSREIASALRGRSLTTEVFPFSFAEALRHQGEDDRPAGAADSARRARLSAALRTYLVTGGFPEVQGLAAHQRVAILQEYVDVVILRDVVERHGVGNVAALRRLIRRLLGHPATSFSIHRFHQDMQAQGVACGKNALHEMLDHLTDAFLVQSVDIDTRSERQRLVNPRRIYPIDTGLAQAFCGGPDADRGRLLETLVFLDLRRRGHEIHYFRSDQGLETDFIARPGRADALAIQVTESLTEPATREREVRGLGAALQAHGLGAGTIVTLDEDDLIRTEEGVIRVVPAWRWLLRAEPDAEPASAFDAQVP